MTHAEFNDQLRGRLASLKVNLVSTTFGRNASKAGLWSVFVRTPSGDRRQVIHVPRSADPHSEEAIVLIVNHFKKAYQP